MSLTEMFERMETSISLQQPIQVQWAEKGRGFGEYWFFEKDGQIHIDNECDDKETIKRILCRMVDDAILEDPTFAELRERREQSDDTSE